MKNKGVILLVLSAMNYGMIGVWARFLSQSFGPFSQLFSRNIILFIVYLILVLATKSWRKIEKSKIKWLVIWLTINAGMMSLSFIVFNNLNVSSGYFLIYSTMTITGVMLGKFLYKEMFNLHKKLSLVLVIAGLALVSYQELNFNSAWFLLLGLFVGIQAGSWNVLSKKVSENYSITQMLFLDSLIGTIFGGIITLILEEKIPSSESNSWFYILGYVATSFIANGALILGFKHIEVQKGSVIMPLEIVFGTIFAFLFLGEFPGIFSVFGGILIFSGSVFVVFEKLTN